MPSHSVHTLEKVNILFGQRKLEVGGAALLLDGRYLLMAGNTACVRAGWLERTDIQAGLAALLAVVFLVAGVLAVGLAAVLPSCLCWAHGIR